jgi:hypothetical protein
MREPGVEPGRLATLDPEFCERRSHHDRYSEGSWPRHASVACSKFKKTGELSQLQQASRKGPLPNAIDGRGYVEAIACNNPLIYP